MRKRDIYDKAWDKSAALVGEDNITDVMEPLWNVEEGKTLFLTTARGYQLHKTLRKAEAYNSTDYHTKANRAKREQLRKELLREIQAHPTKVVRIFKQHGNFQHSSKGGLKRKDQVDLLENTANNLTTGLFGPRQQKLATDFAAERWA